MLSVILMVVFIVENIIGVFVFWWVKNLGWNIWIKMKVGSLRVNVVKVCLVIVVLFKLNWLFFKSIVGVVMNKIFVMRKGIINSVIVVGKVKRSVIFRVWFWDLRVFVKFWLDSWCESLGNKIIFIVMLIRFKGNW